MNADLREGDLVKGTGRIASVPVGQGLVGRVVNALGQPIDGKGPINTDKLRNVERIAPGVIKRQRTLSITHTFGRGPIPKGLPTASTTSPTSSWSLSAITIAGSGF